MDPTGIVNECVGKLFRCVESSLGRQVGYVIHYKTNIQNLQKEVDDLRATTDTVRQKITEAEAKDELIHENVKNWLKNVAEITEKLKTEEILEVEEAKGSLKEKGQPKVKCLHGFCPNPVVRRHRSKKSLQLLDEVTKLINKGRELSDISFLPPKDLQTEVDRLKVAEAAVEQRVTAAEAKGEKILADIKDWQIKVADVTKEAEDFLNDKKLSTDEAREVSGDEIQASEESNESSSHRSKKSLELVKRVTELYGLRELSDISYSVPAEDICLQADEDFEKFESRTSTLKKIMNELECRNSSDLILVYGIGGVGKTTLAEEVLRQAKEEKLFDDTVMVRDVKIPDCEAIQNQIAEKLGVNISEIKTEPARADKINDRIKGKKTLVILDDVWGKFDLKAVGLPRIPSCKILLTSRRKQVFSYSCKQKEFQLGVLDEKEAWILFQKNAGLAAAGPVAANPSIQKVATEVANKCGGLPVLLITVARALEKKALATWKDALKCLKERFDETEHLTQKAFLGIEWSYRQLSDQEQWFFLLCGITLQGNYISLINLLKYSIGLGFFRGFTVEELRNALEALVDKLKSSCLLLDADDNTCVRMYDLVHDAAKRIAFRDKHVLFRDKLEDGDTELKEWPDECFFSECTNIILPCHDIPALPEVSWKCPKLQMLLLHGKDDWSLLEVPSNFFDEMKELKVLGFHNLRLLQLPSSLLFLKKLQTLCLDGCRLVDIALVGELKNLEVLSLVSSKVKQLPEKLKELTHLRYLDLSDCRKLQVIPSKVISNLTRLEELRMRNSFHKWNQASNASLSELMNLSKLNVLEIHVSDASLPSDLFSDKLEKYHIFVGDAWDCSDMKETTLNTLGLQGLPLSELDQGLKMLLERCQVLFVNGPRGVDFADIIDTKVGMSNLTTLDVYECNRLKYLLSSSMARSLVKLKHLKVSDCRMIEEIISRECNEEDTDTIFYELETLRLEDLENLATFSTTQSIEFPLLENLYIRGCTKLGAFTGGPVTRSSTISEDMRKNDSEDVHSETDRQHFLFDDKVRFPRLESLHIHDHSSLFETDELQTIWNNQLAPGSFCRLKEVHLGRCNSLRSIFSPSMMGRLSALETLYIHSCKSVEVVFDECGETNVKEKHATSTSYQLNDGQNLNSVDINNCDSLRNIFKLLDTL